MLCITRKRNEELLIVDRKSNETIRIVMSQVKGKNAKIAIEASDRFEILRTELFEKGTKNECK